VSILPFLQHLGVSHDRGVHTL